MLVEVNSSNSWQVPVIAVFTKYDQFKIDVKMKMEDDEKDITPETLSSEINQQFEKEYLQGVERQTEYVQLESEYFMYSYSGTT